MEPTIGYHRYGIDYYGNDEVRENRFINSCNKRINYKKFLVIGGILLTLVATSTYITTKIWPVDYKTIDATIAQEQKELAERQRLERMQGIRDTPIEELVIPK